MKRYGLTLILMLLAGCAVIPQLGSKGTKMLNEGIKSYDDGNYSDTVVKLQGALGTDLTDPEKVKAHKFLAFTYCISDREKLCREEFKKALAIDPRFELAPAEAGHPIWGPVFRSIKRN
ncbi:MAG TPA: TssQ family T6SS-associated lipoprotein [Burkholderiales bacterium]|nr:TssQ family T6SS-associated lipoprotein [Burkholderiales bacterium]